MPLFAQDAVEPAQPETQQVPEQPVVTPEPEAPVVAPEPETAPAPLPRTIPSPPVLEVPAAPALPRSTPPPLKSTPKPAIDSKIRRFSSQSKPQASTPGAEETIPNMQFPNAPVQDVLKFYEQLTGKKALYDNTVQGTVNIVVTKPVTKREAIRIVETALMLNGFTLVPGSGDIVKVLGISKNPRSSNIPIISEVDEIPDGDQLISFLFKLEYAEPQEVAQTVLQVVAPSPYTAAVALPKSQAVLITETSGVMRNLVRVIGALDRKPADVVSEFITLERADAKTVVEKLTKVFEKPNQGATPAAVPAAQPPQPGEPGQEAAAPAPGETTGTLSEDSLIVGKIRLEADDRTNRIHVVTRPVNMPFIRMLIAEFDSDVPFGEPTTRPLRFVSAGDVLDIVVKAITPGNKDEGGGGGGKAQNPAIPTASGTPSYGSNSQSGRNTDLGITGLSASSVNTAPEARTVGSAKIIADNRSNSIIVLGNQEIKDKIFKVLDQIDIRAPQVMLTAVIGELTLNAGEEFGIDFLLHHGDKKTSPLGVVTRDTGIDLSSVLKNAALTGVGAGGVTGLVGVSKSLDIIVHALESTGRFHITSRPMVFTSNNKKATIASGEQVPVPGTIQSGGYTSGSNGLVSNTNVEYKDVLLKLEVLPLINSDREVTLDIVQQVNNIGGTTTIGGNDIPTITTRAIQTTVSVANEATIVLGGLVTESVDKSKSGIPILSRIPVIGPLFGNTKKTVKRSELIVLIRPTVTMGTDEGIKTSERVQSKLSFPPDLDATLDPPGKRLKLDTEQKLLVPPKATLRSPK